MKYCQNCGKKIKNLDKICPYCGKFQQIIIYNHKIIKSSPLTDKYNPKSISKKAKILLGSIFTVALIGVISGGVIHHDHFIHSPNSINLEDTISQHSFAAQGLVDKAIHNNYIINNNNFNGSKVSFKGDAVKPYDAPNNSDGNDNVMYSINGKTLTISDGTKLSDSSDSDNDTGNNIKFKLHRVDNNDKTLTFYQTSFKIGNNTTHLSPTDQKQNSITMVDIGHAD